MGAAFGCRAVQQPQRWLHLACLSLLRALVLVCSMNWKRHMTNWRQGERDGEGGRGREERRRERVCVWRQSHGQSHLRGGVNTNSSSSIHPSAAAAAAVQRRGAAQGDAAAAVTCDRWQCSHASKGRARPHLHLLLLVVVVVVVRGPRQPAVQHTQRGTAQSNVTWVRAADVPHAPRGRKRASMDACEGPGPRCLVPAMNANGPLDRRHTRVGEVLH